MENLRKLRKIFRNLRDFAKFAKITMVTTFMKQFMNPLINSLATKHFFFVLCPEVYYYFMSFLSLVLSRLDPEFPLHYSQLV